MELIHKSHVNCTFEVQKKNQVKIALTFIAILLLQFGYSQSQPDTIKVMAWNILHGGNDIPNGPEYVIAIISELDPDVVLMVETYGSGKKIAEALDYHFHLIEEEGTALDDESVNLSIYSKFPFGKRYDTEYPFYLGCREIVINHQSIRFCSNWWHYDPWVDQPQQLGMTADELLDWEKTGKKWGMFQNLLPYFETFALQSDTLPVIVGGDMNTPSHLDWTAATRSIHNDLIVPWQTTKTIDDLGYVDTYRMLYPDVMKYPGITWDVKAKVDEHRIDYILYKGNSLKPISSQTYKSHLGEPIQIGNQSIPYPSDHGIVLTTFVIWSNSAQ